MGRRGPSTAAPTPTSSSSCTATPSGICCDGSAAAPAAQSHPQPACHRPPARPGRHRPAGLAHCPRPHPRDLHARRPRELDGQRETTHRREAGHFVRWARTQKLTGLDFPATKWGGPAQILDTEARWGHARRLLHDDHAQTRRPPRRAPRAALRPVAVHDQQAHPRPRPAQRRQGTAPPRPRARRSSPSPSPA